MTKVSVIVPVYNVEKYLDKCLNSLVNQTLKDIEIIVVNDGTKDNSQKTIDEYAKKYKNIKAYKKENGGLSSARNYGLKYASGEYIAFVDSDDWIEKDMYEKMYNKAIEKDFDLVVCGLKYVYEDSSKNVYASSNIKNDIFTKKCIKKSMLNIYPAAWNKIFNKRLFNYKVFFKEKVWFEDVEFIYRLYPYINTIGVINEPFYNYRQREGSITSVFDERLFNYIDNWNGIVQYYKKNSFYDIYISELEYCYVRYLFATFIKSAAKSGNKNMYDKAVFNAIYNVKKQFPHYKKNKYMYRNKIGFYLIAFNKLISNIVYKYVNRV